MGIFIDDIPTNLQGLLEIVGEDKFNQIVRYYGGEKVYIPTYNTLIKPSRNRDIIKRYNGVNAGILGREYNITANQVKRIANR